ncbi:hypothetical protein [Streptomyces sp. UH6]|uniref:hypothetical protein n=1 Tax=Streptomyces sp. UH6 TaxID=2748379 RepID=UPI0035BBC581
MVLLAGTSGCVTPRGRTTEGRNGSRAAEDPAPEPHRRPVRNRRPVRDLPAGNLRPAGNRPSGTEPATGREPAAVTGPERGGPVGAERGGVRSAVEATQRGRDADQIHGATAGQKPPVRHGAMEARGTPGVNGPRTHAMVSDRRDRRPYRGLGLMCARRAGQNAPMAPFLVSRRHVDLLRVAGMLCRVGRRCRAACR